jgi:hypothetical protein
MGCSSLLFIGTEGQLNKPSLLRHPPTTKETNMKDRSFIHRQRQSQLAKADNLRRFGPTPVHDPMPAPKLTLWGTFVAFVKRFLKWCRV